MHGSVVDRVERDYAAILNAAEGIKGVLARPTTRGDLERVVYDVLDFHERRLRPHLEIQDEALLSIAREGHIEGKALDEARTHIQRLRDSTYLMRREVETGSRLRGVLENAEIVMREYVMFAQRALMPWLASHLGDEQLVEANTRYRQIIASAR